MDNIFVVDEIIDKYAVLENMKTKEIVNVELNKLPKVKETDVLRYENNQYVKDNKTKEIRVQVIKEKLERLKK